MSSKLGVHWLRMFSLAPWSNIPFKSTLFGWWKTSLSTLTHFDPIWAFYPLVRGTWVQNLGLTGSECVPWLLDKRFHSNPPSFYYEKPALVHLPILGLSPPGTGDLGTKFRVNLEKDLLMVLFSSVSKMVLLSLTETLFSLFPSLITQQIYIDHFCWRDSNFEHSYRLNQGS